MLAMRLITAMILLALFIPMTIYAPLVIFSYGMIFVLFLAAWEWARLLHVRHGLSVVFALLVGASLLLLMHMHEPVGLLFSLVKAASIFWLVMAPYLLLRKPNLSQGVWRVFLLCVAWISLAAAWVVLCWAREKGVVFLFSMLALVWVADSFAYFAGRFFGKHRLAPNISPGKTWEGMLGGLCAVLLIAMFFVNGMTEVNVLNALKAQYGSWMYWVLVSILVAYSVVGDLFESLMKRQAGKKDSSQLLPGHGGVLDRIDALLPVISLVMFFLY